jgi:hypothetical protein
VRVQVTKETLENKTITKQPLAFTKRSPKNLQKPIRTLSIITAGEQESLTAAFFIGVGDRTTWSQEEVERRRKIFRGPPSPRSRLRDG